MSRPKTHRTLVDPLRNWAQRDPEFLGYSWLSEDGNVAQTYSYAGDRVLLIHPPGLEFAAALFGCLFAGLIAVPAYPPCKPRDQQRIAGICRSAAPVAVLGGPDVFEHAESCCARWAIRACCGRMDPTEPEAFELPDGVIRKVLRGEAGGA